MDAVTPPPDFAEMRRQIEAAGADALNPDAKNRQARFERAISEAMDLRADAIKIYVRHARNPDVRGQAYKTRKHAERKVGSLLIAAERAGFRFTGRPAKGTKVDTPTELITLTKLGITRKQSQTWQRLTRMSDAEFEAWIEAECAKKSQRGRRRANTHAQPGGGALVPIRPGIQLPGKLTRTGWRLPKDMSLDEWLTCGQVLDLAEGALQWWRGDWWAFGVERKYGDGEALAEKADINYQTIRDYGWVAGAFKDLSRRRDNLTFEHHRVVASLVVAEQEKWLDLAESGGWSRAELRRELRQGLKVARQAELDGEKDGPQSEPTPSDQGPSPSPQAPTEPESAATPVSHEPMCEVDGAPAARDLVLAPTPDAAPPTAPAEPAPRPDPWADQRALFRDSIRGLRELKNDFGPLIATMRSGEADEAKDVVFALSAALHAEIDRARPVEEPMSPAA